MDDGDFGDSGGGRSVISVSLLDDGCGGGCGGGRSQGSSVTLGTRCRVVCDLCASLLVVDDGDGGGCGGGRSAISVSILDNDDGGGGSGCGGGRSQRSSATPENRCRVICVLCVSLFVVDDGDTGGCGGSQR